MKEICELIFLKVMDTILSVHMDDTNTIDPSASQVGNSLIF